METMPSEDLLIDQSIIIRGFIIILTNQNFFMSAFNMLHTTCTTLMDILFNSFQTKLLIRQEVPHTEGALSS